MIIIEFPAFKIFWKIWIESNKKWLSEHSEFCHFFDINDYFWRQKNFVAGSGRMRVAWTLISKEKKMQSLKFLDKIDRNALKLENKIYRGAIPWFLLCSDEKKNCICFHIQQKSWKLLQHAGRIFRKYGKSLSIFENTSSNKEDLTGINIEILDILKNRSDFILFLNLQITLDIFLKRLIFLISGQGRNINFQKW